MHLDNTSDNDDNESLNGNSSEEENDMPVGLNEPKRKRAEPAEQIKPLNMSSHGIMTGQVNFVLSLRFPANGGSGTNH